VLDLKADPEPEPQDSYRSQAAGSAGATPRPPERNLIPDEVCGTQNERLLYEMMNRSRLFDWINMTGLLIVVLGIIIHSDAALRDKPLGVVMEHLQWLTATFFLITYIMRLYACPASPKFAGSNSYVGTSWKEWKEWPRTCYVTDYTGMVDLISWLPFMLAHFFATETTPAVVLRMMQILIILKIDRKLPAFALLDDVLLDPRGTGRLLACTAIFSAIMWILFAALFYLIEKDDKSTDGAFSDMPMSLFITMIFLGGEWCIVDLAIPLGEITGVMLAMMGIGVCGIPVAIFFDGYCEIAEDYDEKYLKTGQDPPRDVLWMLLRGDKVTMRLTREEWIHQFGDDKEFGKYDANNDGIIDEEEWAAAKEAFVSGRGAEEAAQEAARHQGVAR